MKTMVLQAVRGVLNGIVKALYIIRPHCQAALIIPTLPAQQGYTYKLPENLMNLPSGFRGYFESVAASQPKLPVRHLYKVANGNVSWHGTVFRNFQLFIPSLFYPGVAAQYANCFLLKQWIGKHLYTATEDVVAVVHNQFSAVNYFHWIIESLPKLLVVREHYPNCIIALPFPTPAYMAATVKLLGFDRTVPIGRDKILKASQIVVSEATLAQGHQDPILMRKIRGEILASLTINQAKPHRKIYVSRAKQRMRKVINESQIAELLSRYGFEEIYFEDMPFAEQVRLMAETDVLVGVHGANLTNALFLQKGAKVIELINEEAPNLVYYRMSSYLDLLYFSIPCQPEVDVEDENNASLLVGIALLECALKEIFCS